MTSTPSRNDEELPGMLAVAKGVAEQKWPHTMDAAVWAAEYVKLNPGADEGLMLSWFANAIMAGYDTAQSRHASEKQDELKLLRKACDAAFAFIDSHVADPDLTDEMIVKHADYKDARRALEGTP